MKTLENYRAFSYVARALVVLFTVFTYSLARELEEKSDKLAPTYISSEYAL